MAYFWTAIRFAFLATALGALTLADATAPAADIAYSLRLSQEGSPVDSRTATAGDYTLEIWGTTLDNEIASGVYGGILQFSVDLNNPTGGVTSFENHPHAEASASGLALAIGTAPPQIPRCLARRFRQR